MYMEEQECPRFDVYVCQLKAARNTRNVHRHNKSRPSVRSEGKVKKVSRKGQIIFCASCVLSLAYSIAKESAILRKRTQEAQKKFILFYRIFTSTP